MDALNGTLPERSLLPVAIAVTVADLIAAGLMIVLSVLLKGMCMWLAWSNFTSKSLILYILL